MQLRTPLRYLGYAALALLTLELAARVDDHIREGAALLKPYTINTLFRPSPQGREGVPSARFAKWQLNSLGYRGPEPLAGRPNILTYGASETFGLYEGPGKEYPRELEARLQGEGAYNVINIAIPGIRIGRLGYLDLAMDKTHPTHVVVYPSPANYIGTTVPFCRQPSVPVASPTGLAEQIRLMGKLDQQAKKWLPPALMNTLRSASLWWAARKEVPMRTVPQETLEALRADLHCVVNAALTRNATPVLVTHATYFGDQLRPQDAQMLMAWRRFYPELLEEGFIDLERRANEVIRSVAIEAKVPLVDAAAAIAAGPANFADFVHFTDQGAQNMGELIAKAIKAAPREEPKRR